MQIKLLLAENKKMLLRGFEEFGNDKVGSTVRLLDQIHGNLTYLASAADFQTNSRYVL